MVGWGRGCVAGRRCVPGRSGLAGERTTTWPTCARASSPHSGPNEHTHTQARTALRATPTLRPRVAVQLATPVADNVHGRQLRAARSRCGLGHVHDARGGLLCHRCACRRAAGHEATPVRVARCGGDAASSVWDSVLGASRDSANAGIAGRRACGGHARIRRRRRVGRDRGRRGRRCCRRCEFCRRLCHLRRRCGCRRNVICGHGSRNGRRSGHDARVGGRRRDGARGDIQACWRSRCIRIAISIHCCPAVDNSTRRGARGRGRWRRR